MQDAAPETGPLYNCTVIWYDRVKGYGFLAPEGYKRDVLIHNTVIRLSDVGRDYLLKGDRVRCRVSLHRGRPSAADLEKVSLVPDEG